MDCDTIVKYISLSESILDVKLDITKPETKIDFEKDNAKFIDIEPMKNAKPIKRGDVRKKS